MSNRSFTLQPTGICCWLETRSLESLHAKFLLNVIWTTPWANFIGVFQYPISAICDEADFSKEQATSSLEALIEIGLIRYDWTTGYISPSRWAETNTPKSPDVAKSRLKEFTDQKTAPPYILLPALSELICEIAYKMSSWDTTTKSFERFAREFSRVTEMVVDRHGDAFMVEITAAVAAHSLCSLSAILSLSPSLNRYHNMISTSREHHVDVIQTSSQHDVDREEKEKEEEKKEQGRDPTRGPSRLSALPETVASPLAQRALANRHN